MTKAETISNLKAYLDGDTAIGNTISLRSVLESALGYLNLPLPSNLDEAAEEYYDEWWDDLGGVTMVRNCEHDIWYPSSVIETVFKAGAEWMAEQKKS